MDKLAAYFNKNKLVLNVQKSNFILIGTEKPDFVVKYNQESIKQCQNIKILGVIFDNKLGFAEHLNVVSNKVAKTVGALSRVRHFLPTNVLNIVYKSLIVPQMTYGCCLWGFTYDRHKDRLSKLQKRAARLITFSDFRASSQPIFEQLVWMPIERLIGFETMKFIYKSLNSMASETQFFTRVQERRTRTNNQMFLKVSNAKFTYTQNTIFHKGIKLWNNLDLSLRQSENYNIFVNSLKTYFLK